MPFPIRAARPLLATLLTGLLAAALAQTAPAPSPASSAPPASPAATPSSADAITPGDGRLGTFKTVQGEVTLANGEARRAAVVGDGLMPGDRLSTGPGSAAALTLRDGTVLSLGADSALDLATFEFEPTTQQGSLLVRLARGSLRMITGLIARLQPEQVKVTTPTAVIGVRGTDFIVEARP